MSAPLRVAILAPPWFPAPPPRYGGVEWIVALLADGLALAGHDVTLFASGDSRPVRARLSSVYPTAPSEHIGETYWEIRHVLACYARQDEFDIVHDHTGMLGAAIGGALRVPVVHTAHGTLTGEPGELYEQICAVAPNLRLISISLNQRRPKPDLPWIANCPNAVDFSLYPFPPEAERDDYLLFLGRMTAAKGAHRAVAVALEAGLPLKIAGKCREPEEQAYFEQFVRPYLGPQIEYLGEVTHGVKVELLQRARATLFPIRWDEPFGLVLIESMACGTPVIASRHGAVTEIVEDGVSGIVVDDYRAMPAALERADRLDRRRIRQYVEERFAPERMVADYLGAYAAAVGSAG